MITRPVFGSSGGRTGRFYVLPCGEQRDGSRLTTRSTRLPARSGRGRRGYSPPCVGRKRRPPL